MKLTTKITLTRLGALCTPGMVYSLNGCFNYLHVGWWLKAHGYRTTVRVNSRYELFDRIADVVGEEAVLYLEFGVHTGDSMRYWSRLLKNPNSRLHGFDSFTGLPHDWSLEGHERGYFSTGGVVPRVDDPRVSFFPGWFDDTLPAYVWPDHDVLIVMMDADLYSSTTTALTFVRDRLRPGSYLYFDQFHHRCDELRAFAELEDEHEIDFRLIGTSKALTNVLFQRAPEPGAGDG